MIMEIKRADGSKAKINSDHFIDAVEITDGIWRIYLTEGKNHGVSKEVVDQIQLQHNKW